ncbi:hypothetical protein ACHAXS_001138, partial [Conticribra weissflogii]
KTLPLLRQLSVPTSSWLSLVVPPHHNQQQFLLSPWPQCQNGQHWYLQPYQGCQPLVQSVKGSPEGVCGNVQLLHDRHLSTQDHGPWNHINATKESGTWLTTLPCCLNSMQLLLQKFQDALCLHYNRQPLNLEDNCNGCCQWFWSSTQCHAKRLDLSADMRH